MPFLFVGDDPGLSLLPSKPLINLFTAGVLLKFRIRTSNSDGNYWGFCLFVCFNGWYSAPTHSGALLHKAEGGARVSLHFMYWGNLGMRRLCSLISPALIQNES